MRLSELSEARDPNYEKMMEPKLRAPISIYNGYTSPRRRFQHKIHRAWTKAQNELDHTHKDGHDFDASYKKRIDPTRGIDTAFHSVAQSPPDFVYDRPKGYVPSSVENNDLTSAVRYWQKNFSGERWPALEQAFLNRSRTFTKGGGDYVRPRTTLFAYLADLKQPWPEGETLAKTFEDRVTSGRFKGRNKEAAFNSPHAMNYRLQKGTLDAAKAPTKALWGFYLKNFKNKRWEPLEQKLLASHNDSGIFDHPTISYIMSYLKVLSANKLSWFEGEEHLRELVLALNHTALMYAPTILNFVLSHRLRPPALDAWAKECVQQEIKDTEGEPEGVHDQDEFDTKGPRFDGYGVKAGQLLRQYAATWGIKD